MCIKLNIVLLLVLSLTGLQAQSLYVKEKTGNQTAYGLSNIQKMNFSQGSIKVHKKTGNPDAYMLSGLRYLNFSDLTTNIAETNNNNIDVLVYPNPVSDVINIKIPTAEIGNYTIDIFALDGRLLLSKQITNSGDFTIKVNELETGIYLCKYTNGKQSKTVKISKQ